MSHSTFENVDFSGRDFSGRDLSHSVFRNCSFDDAVFPEMENGTCAYSEFICCSLRRTKCYKTNFAFSIFPACTFEPSDCYGMVLSISCKTFENVHVSQQWWYMWLMIAASMRPPQHPVKANLRDLLISFIGTDRYIKLKTILERRSY